MAVRSEGNFRPVSYSETTDGERFPKRIATRFCG